MTGHGSVRRQRSRDPRRRSIHFLPRAATCAAKQGCDGNGKPLPDLSPWQKFVNLITPNNNANNGNNAGGNGGANGNLNAAADNVPAPRLNAGGEADLHAPPQEEFGEYLRGWGGAVGQAAEGAAEEVVPVAEGLTVI